MTELRNPDFYTRDALEVAPELVGKLLCRHFDDGSVQRLRISETECYRGEEDKGCHASKGRTKRTDIMFGSGGYAYVYLVYGMHWLLNVVTGEANAPQAVLIRACEGYTGPAKLTKALSVDKSFAGENFTASRRLWLEDDGTRPQIRTAPRVGIDYAGEYWSRIEWRFIGC